jgi:hypothetical protein
MSGAENKLRIDAVWMAVSVDENGDEGVCAVNVNGSWMPLLAADEARLPFVIQQATDIAAATQQLIRIVRLTVREEIKTIDGRS